MNGWVAVIAAVAGAAIALVGQYLTRRRDNDVRLSEALLEQCSQLVALSEDFRNRLWEESQLGQARRVDDWDLAAYRLAAARLQILCHNQALLEALDELSSSGKGLGGYWRRGEIDQEELGRRSARHRAATHRFTAESKRYIRSRLRAA